MHDLTEMLAAQLAGALEAAEQTPTTDRGVTVTWAGIHWLTGVSLRPVEEVRDVVSKHLWGLVLEDSPSGIWTYQSKAVERVSKAFVAWSEHLHGQPGVPRPDVAVNLPGEACELLGTAGLIALVRELDLKVTRLDLAWDTDIFTPREVFDTWKAGNCVSHIKKKPKWIEEEHDTLYIGSRSADNARMVRFYNRRGPTRVELELHKKRADLMWNVLVEIELDGWSEAGLHYLVDFVDFRDREVDVNVGRCPRLDWWEDFTDGASRLALPIPRKAPNLEAQREWMETSVAPTLALVADSLPDATAWVRSLLLDGRRNRKPRQSAMLAVVLAGVG